MKDKKVQIRMSESDYERLCTYSQLSGLSKSEFIRRIIEKKEPKIIENLNPNGIKEIITLLSRIGNFQKKIDNDLVRIYNGFHTKLDISSDEIRANYNELIRTRTELIEELADVKFGLRAILKEIQ